MSRMLDILAAGMVTAVGLDRPSAAAAMRGKLDGFQETRFVGSGGDWLVGAPVPLPRNFIGMKRMAHMAAAAISEVFTDVPDARGRSALILCLNERDRPGAPVQDGAKLAAMIGEIVDQAASVQTRIIHHGRPSGFVALQQAQKLIREGQAKYAVIAGVDSYLTTLSVAHYLAESRFLTPDNPNGFIPGEAAAAILVSAPGPGDFALTGLGMAREMAHIYNEDELPLRGDGMVEAYRGALQAAGLEMARIGYRISDLIGEHHYFKQTALASIRLIRGRHDDQDLWSPAENVGNIGAAVVPLMIGQAFTAARKGYHKGNPVLIEASADDGACGAAIFHARAA